MPSDWHPMFVHFALALPLTASLLYPLALPSARAAAHWCLGLGVAFLWLAVGSGMWAALLADASGEARAAVARHQYWGWGTTVLYSLAVALALSLPRARRLLIVLLSLAAISAVVTGWLGGVNVHVHGVGVQAGGQP